MAQKVFILAMALAILICTLVGMTSAVTDGKVVKLTNDSTGDSFSAWSPDGAKIVFTSNRAGISDVWVMGSDGSNQVQLTEIGVSDNPKWSPDGAKIAFTSNRTGNKDIWVMDSDGSNKVQLTTSSADDLGSTWSPSGDKLAFVSTRSGNWDIWVMDCDGSNKTQLTTNGGDEIFQAWSPDGSLIAFISARSGNRDIWVMDSDGSNKVQLTTDVTFVGGPVSWSPYGKKIAYSALFNGDDTMNIWVMNSDGSEKVQLTTGKGGERPLWSPDGKKIAYTSDGNIYVITLEEETTPTTTATPVTPSPTEKIPGFEAIIAISALLVVAYIVRLEIVW